MNPQGYIPEQPLTETFITPDNTLVDDTVALVDDPNALVGSQVTAIADFRVTAQPNPPKGKITKRR